MKKTKKILVFTGSNSSRSINQKLAVYAGSLIEDNTVDHIRLDDYEIPMYSEDRELSGFPEDLEKLHNEIRKYSGLIISVPEHNGNLPAFFKNILDWLSRFDRPFLAGIKIFLMSTSPGGRGGSSSLEAAKKILPSFKGDVSGTFSLSFFSKNFSDRITNPVKDLELCNSLKKFSEEL